MERKLFRFFKKPEQIISSEEEPVSIGTRRSLIYGPDGTIEFVGTPDDAEQWMRSRQDEGAEVEVYEGGVLLPGMTDTHYHPGIYGMLELLQLVDISNVRTIGELQQKVRAAVNAIPERNDGQKEPLVVVDFNSAQLGTLKELNIDEIVADHPVFVLDRSFHAGAGNEAAIQMLKTYLEREFPTRKKQNGGFDFPGSLKGKEFTEMFVILAMDYAESFHTVEDIQEKMESKVESYLEKGVTAVHEMDVTSWNQLMSYLLFHKEFKSTHPNMEFPVRRLFVSDRILELLRTKAGELEKSGLLTEEIKGIMGVKLYADGAFGCETAYMTDPYLSKDQKHNHGIIVNRVKEAEQAMRNVLALGLNKVAVHSIGDAGIQRAIDFAKRWKAMAEKRGVSPEFRFEHFELPLGNTVKEAAELGAWVSMQSNFGVEDVVYQDRLGKRARMVCPHQDIVNEGVPMMLGSDGMPTSMLYVVWSAMHHPDPKQRLDVVSAVTAATAAAGSYEGSTRGQLVTGAKTDIVVASPELLSALADGRLAEDYFREASRPAGERKTPIRSKVGELESTIVGVFKDGEQVFKK